MRPAALCERRQERFHEHAERREPRRGRGGRGHREEGGATLRRANNSLFRKVTPEQYGFAAATLVAFFGVAIFGPKVREMRKPRRQRLADRARETARRTARETRERAQDVRDEAGRRLRQLGGGTIRR